jgi:hypothetical protein
VRLISNGNSFEENLDDVRKIVERELDVIKRCGSGKILELSTFRMRNQCIVKMDHNG